MIEYVKLYVLDAPIWYGPNIIDAKLNKTLTINCTICAEPMPTEYKWYKDGQHLEAEVSKLNVNMLLHS